jgi:hypothetical protein
MSDARRSLYSAKKQQKRDCGLRKPKQRYIMFCCFPISPSTYLSYNRWEPGKPRDYAERREEAKK